MNRIAVPNILAKIGLNSNKSRLQAAAVAGQSVLPQLITLTPVDPAISASKMSFEHILDKPGSHGSFFKKPLNLMHKHTVIVMALGLLIIGSAATQLAANYWVTTHITNAEKSVKFAKLPAKSIAGFNITVPAAQLQSKLQTVTGQPATLTVGTNAVPVGSDTIKSWLQITANKNKSEYYIHTNEAAMASSLAQLAGKYAKAPVNQVTATEDGTSVVVVGGRDGTALSDPNSLKTQAQQSAKNVLGGAGLQFSTPLATVPFQAVTPAAFDKVLIANVTTKKMWAYQNGQLVNTFLTSDGAPATPTPLGEFHVYAKFTVQDMSGLNPNGTKYFQPKVPWVNYFYAGSAVHGVYWHPLSWFGAINSSHGCVGLPVDQAEWVFNWAPIGTTVITHA